MWVTSILSITHAQNLIWYENITVFHAHFSPRLSVSGSSSKQMGRESKGNQRQKDFKEPKRGVYNPFTGQSQAAPR